MIKITLSIFSILVLCLMPVLGVAAEEKPAAAKGGKVEILKTSIESSEDAVPGSRTQKKLHLYAVVVVQNVGKQPARDFYIKVDCKDCKKLKWKVYQHQSQVADRIKYLGPGDQETIRVPIASLVMGMNVSKDTVKPPAVEYSVAFGEK